MIEAELFSVPATELVGRLRARELSAVELFDAHVARILAVNGSLNAIAEERFEAARLEARAADDTLAKRSDPESLPPLLGLPITVKEFIAVEGMARTGGLLSARGRLMRSDATAVSRLKRAGAVVMATTNVPEGGMWIETTNRIYGRTNNPWNLAYTPGGSSGGEAALVAAGASPLGIGSDIGGSVRIPAAFCGVTAHKATGRMIPNTGHWGPKKGDTGPFLSCGPISRAVADLMPALEIMAGPDGVDRHTERWALGDPGSVDIATLSVFTLEGFGGFKLSPEVIDARDRAVAALVARGARHQSLSVEGIRRAVAVWAMAMEQAAADTNFAVVLGEGQPISLTAELLRLVLGRPRFTLPALGLVLLEKVMHRLPRRLVHGVPALAELSAELSSHLGGRGIIVHPTYTRPTPRHRGALLTPLHPVMTALFNVLEVPGTQIPVGFATTGLPLGVQIIADRGNDHVAIAAAAAVEAEVGRLMPAPLI